MNAENTPLLKDLPVMGVQSTTFVQFYRFLTSKNLDMDAYYARRLFDSYQKVCSIEGVNPVVALSQMIHETDFLLFTGSVRPTQYNYAGLGSTSDGVAGLSFGTMNRGVRAHVQHLKAYGTEDQLVEELVDPRFSYVVRGSARTVMALTGKWSVDPLYGEKLLVHAYRLINSPGIP